MGELAKLPNIGPKLESQLAEVGITTAQQLKQAGSREAWLRILARDSSACTMRMMAFEGAIRGVNLRDLDDDVKRSLKDFYKQHKR